MWVGQRGPVGTFLTKKKARRLQSWRAFHLSANFHRFHVLPDSPPGDVADGRKAVYLRLRSRYAVYITLSRLQPPSAPLCA